MQIRSLAAGTAVLFAASASLALTACGGSSPSKAASSSPQDAMLKFARCMRQHGINFPDPTGSGPVSIHITNQQAFDSAQTACERYRAAGEKSISPAQRAQFQDRALQFARCMRAHGVNLPDPQTTGNGGAISIHKQVGPGGGGGGPSGPDPSSPTFQAAQKACQSLLGGKGAFGGGFAVSKGGPGGPGSKGGPGAGSGGNATFFGG
jgi:hypothetical protein